MKDKETLRDKALDKASVMETDEYAAAFPELFKAYATLRIHGIQSTIAFRRVWGEEFFDSFTDGRIYAIESTELYQNQFREQLLNTPINDLWNDKISINKLLSLVNNVYEKGSTQLRAIQELNVLIGITVVDENGKTKRGSKMSDFYTDIGTEDLREPEQIDD